MRRGVSARAITFALGVAMVVGLPACTGSVPDVSQETARSTASDISWVPFGPFQKPAEFVDDPGVTGATTIRVSGLGEVELKATEILPDAEIESERYTYAYDGDDPVIVAVLQVAETLHYRRSTKTLHATYVMGLSVEREPKVLTRWTAYKGNPHRVTLTGLTDQGVVVIFLEGRLHDAGEDTRLDGIDVVRGTDVWWKQHGYPGSDQSMPTFYTADAPEACATRVEQYRVASGTTIRSEEHSDTGSICLRADGH